MSNKKVILGIAAGVAALAVVGVILKRRGYLDGVIERAEGLSGDLADKYHNVKETARKKFDEVVQKGGDIASKLSNHSQDGNAETSIAGKAGNNKGNSANINPATA